MQDSTHQGGDTPLYSVLQSSSSVKLKVKGQPPKIADSQSQTAFWLVKSQPGWSRVNQSTGCPSGMGGKGYYCAHQLHLGGSRLLRI